MNQDELYTVVGGRGTMTVFEIYIKTTPERLWEAITDGEMRKKYSFGVGTESDWKPGSEYRSSVPGVIDIASGKNVEVDPPRAGSCRASPRSGARRSSAKASRG